MTSYLSPKAFLLKHPRFVRVEYHRKWAEPDFYMTESEFISRASTAKALEGDTTKEDMVAVKNWTLDINERQSYRIYRDQI